MPEINNNPNIISKASQIQPKADKPTEMPAPKAEEICENKDINLGEDPRSITGRSLVKNMNSPETKEITATYVKAFEKDPELASFVMDATDSFVEGGLSLEESVEAAVLLTKKINPKTLNAIKEVPGVGGDIANICRAIMEVNNGTLESAIKATARAFKK